MFAAERHRVIAGRARSAGRVDVLELSRDLGVTPETIRRDLTALAGQGLLRRVHGGAVLVEMLTTEPELATRMASMTAEKDRIAAAALREVPSEGTILLDAGTTVARLAEILPTDRLLTVVTNSLPIATILSTRPNFTVLITGGRVRGATLASVDEWAARSLSEVCCDVAFLGTNGVSVGRGLTTPDPPEAAVKRAMLHAARRVIALADSSKVGRDYFASFGRLTDVDVLITDSGLDEAEATTIAAAGPKVVRA